MDRASVFDLGMAAPYPLVPGGNRSPAVDALRRIAFLLERTREPSYRVKAFRTAAASLEEAGLEQVEALAKAGRLKDLPGIGDTTAKVVLEALGGEVPHYLSRLEHTTDAPVVAGGEALRAALRGDCHTHSDWSDGGSPIEEMATTGKALGHDYMVLTDHSARLTIAHGLDRERLLRQLDVVAQVNEELAPFRLLTGMEVDIFEDGTLDADEDILERLDVVVASVHSKLRMPADEMTPRMVAAIANPHVDILGHCTGRQVVGRGRPESDFDADVVFAACAQTGTAVEINCRPERLDPPRRLLSLAIEWECLFSVDTDAHAPGQLDWQAYGCSRAEECGVDPARVVNTWALDDLLAWTAAHGT
ncbi:MAG: PHP domain-containing protein [Acidimicrobiales bacterium]